MKIEILTSNGIKSAFKELDIKASRTYKNTEEPHYEVWEIEKSDLLKLEEAAEWPKGWGWFAFGGGSRRGTACGFLTVNNNFLIGWDTESGNDKYDKLTDYLHDGLGIKSNDNVCATVSDLARVNGMTIAELFKKYEG